MAAKPSSTSGDFLADRRFAFAGAAAAEGDWRAAADLAGQALERVPDWAPAWFVLGKAQAELFWLAPQEPRHRVEALAALADYLARDPLDRLGAGLIVARLGGSASMAASPAYIASLFDDYAPRFDAHLQGALAYRAPALLRAAVAEAARLPGRRLRFETMLDLGCGTGLAGAPFADLAEKLIGVDLSAAMLEEARAKGIYTRLVQAEISAFLAAEGAACVDLVIAADVFVYIGDLGAIFLAIARVLRSGGLFAFTTQAHEGEGYVLGEDLRYAHSAAHLADLATRAGFNVVLSETVSTRKDRGIDVPGLVVVLTKQARGDDPFSRLREKGSCEA